jgi:hypothetical protein
MNDNEDPDTGGVPPAVLAGQVVDLAAWRVARLAPDVVDEVLLIVGDSPSDYTVPTDDPGNYTTAYPVWGSGPDGEPVWLGWTPDKPVTLHRLD